MNLRHRYKVSVEDETTLESKLKVSWKLPAYIFGILMILLVAVLIAVLILAFSPLRNSLPGYLKESERAATEEQHLRLDSILHIYDINEAYLSNIFNVLDPVIDDDEIEIKKETTLLSSDSLLPASKEERDFIEFIRERDKFNIASSSAADAETLMFEMPHSAAVISEDSQNSYIADIILPHGSHASAVADGKIISVANSSLANGGFEIIIQHPKGFLSKTGRVGSVIVRPGDHVSSGQIIATTSSLSGRKSDIITFELWHNGDRLVPSMYLKGYDTINKIIPD